MREHQRITDIYRISFGQQQLALGFEFEDLKIQDFSEQEGKHHELARRCW